MRGKNRSKGTYISNGYFALWVFGLSAFIDRGAAAQGEKPDLRWVALPAGTLRMGSDSDVKVEKPVHEVKVPTFMMTKTEITVEQYAMCVRAGRCTKPSIADDLFWRRYCELCGSCPKPTTHWRVRCNWSVKGRNDHPINCVDWKQARSFCFWAGGRLPSEAEWEHAARSGEGWKYPWGDEEASCSRVVMYEDECRHGCGVNGTRKVCSKPSGNTKQGLCDMLGNVSEWVEDCWHRDYHGAPNTGNPWTMNCDELDYRVSRSGGWAYQYKIGTSDRRYEKASCRTDFQGFRCAKQQ
jgi:formylglycine-generating enzyme required for sulfatase activity